MKRQMMAEQWDSFARAVIPRDASAVQRHEMRRAFYAGAQGILYGVIAALGPHWWPNNQQIQMLANLEIELSEFAEAVKKESEKN